jgi:hypothetical protein
MVVGTEENAASESGFESEEFIVPEFGRVDLSWFDFSRKYRGAIFRLGQDASKQISEIAGFSANFDLPGIRTACIDLFKTEGYCLFEIERNTKPTDLAVHYSRERWNLLDATGKTGDVLRPWIKTEYRAKYVPEKVVSLVAEQLKLQPDIAANLIIRINFKERTFGLICEERFAELMPTGSFSKFSLPTEAMLALVEKYRDAEEPVMESPAELALSGAEVLEADSEPAAPSGIAAPAAEEVLMSVSVEEQLDSAAGPAGFVAQGSITVEVRESESIASASTSVTDSAASPAIAPDSPAAAAVAQAASEPVGDTQSTSAAVAPATVEPAANAPAPATSTPAASAGPTAAKSSESPLPGSTKALEQFIQRKGDRPPQEKTESRKEPLVEGFTPKYATYSRSEVDQLMKQQLENISSALGGKISSAQRMFQDAVEKQEKTFSKLSDDFVVKFDQTRVRLENTSKDSADSIHAELETFKKDLSKELGEYRAQINKAVVPVARFIEDKNAKPPEKAQKEVAAQAKGQQSQVSNEMNFLRTMLYLNLAGTVVILVCWFYLFGPMLEKIQTAVTLMQPEHGSAASSTRTDTGSPGTSGVPATGSPESSK